MNKHVNYRKRNKHRIKERLTEKPKNVDPFEDGFESIFKVELPVSPLKVGFGYEGLILRDKEKDELQCHICGKWFKGLSSHVKAAHNIISRDYKKKFGLPLSFPLVSKSTSSLMSKNAIETDNYKNLISPIEANKIAVKVHTGKAKYRQYYRNNASFHNKHGICDKQINSRFLVCCFISGRQAKENDLKIYDRSLESRIRRRYETYQNYINIIGKELYENRSENSRESRIAILREYYFDHMEIPKIKDFGVVTVDKILDTFGSWESALVHSGFEKLKQLIKK